MSFKPVNTITIDFSTLGGVSPADGTIDPNTVEAYRTNVPITGSTTNPTVNDGDTIILNEYPITFIAGNLASIVTQINNVTNLTKVIASVHSNHLQLIKEPLSITRPPYMVGNQLVIDKLGFANPTKEAIPNLPANINIARAKARGNIRWKMLIEQLSFVNTIEDISNIIVTGGSITSDPTSLSFRIRHSNTFYDYDNNGNLTYNIADTVARILTSDYHLRQTVWNAYTAPPPKNGPVGLVSEMIYASKLTDDYSVAKNAVTVVQSN